MIRGKLSQLMVRVESNQGSTLLVTHAMDISIIAHKKVYHVEAQTESH